MKKTAGELIKSGGERFFASDWNSLVAEARAREIQIGRERERAESGIPSWRVTARRIDPGWAIGVAPGFINDQVPTIPYLRIGDPRPWEKPDNYRAPGQSDPDFSETFLERDLLEDDPPILLATADADFSALPDDRRPPFFRTEEMWEMEIRRGHVILTAQPIRPVFFPEVTPPPFARYRLALVRQLPARSFAVRAGGWIELATIYLVRDPAVGDPGDRVLVAQKEFHDIGALVVEPRIVVGGGGAVPPGFSGIGLGFADSVAMGGAAAANAFADQVQAAVDNILVPTASVEFWTV